MHSVIIGYQGVSVDAGCRSGGSIVVGGVDGGV